MLPQTFEEAFTTVQKLVNQFRRNESFYLKADYSEARARNEFINKFFIALGWDVQHEYQTNPLERDVEIEKGVDVEGRGKKADYAFLAPNFRDVAFFAEAKKPRGSLTDAQDYFQTVRYGWHQKTPVAVLTDFKEFHILDCRAKPDIDYALNQALEKFHYSDYEDTEKFRRIYYIFARAEVHNNSIEKYVATLPKPKGKVKQQALFAKGGYLAVDEALLQDLDGYRARLARAFKRGNPELDSYALTEVTQRTLDRLIFMRFLEDKLIEPDEIIERFER